MQRRPLLALPLLTLLPAAAWRPAAADAGELRVGGAVPAGLAAALARHTARPVRLAGGDAVEALNRGHLELALLDPAEAARAAALMRGRVVALADLPGGTVAASRRVLPPGLRRALRAALSEGGLIA